LFLLALHLNVWKSYLVYRFRQEPFLCTKLQFIDALTLSMLSKMNSLLLLSFKTCKNSLLLVKSFLDILITSECQKNWISNEAPRFVGPHLNQNSLQRSKICCLALRPPITTIEPYANIFDLDETVRYSLSYPDPRHLTLRQHFHYERHWRTLNIEAEKKFSRQQSIWRDKG